MANSPSTDTVCDSAWSEIETKQEVKKARKWKYETGWEFKLKIWRQKKVQWRKISADLQWDAWRFDAAAHV